MATLICLACGHDNNVDDESCSSCSSSLNLKLCSSCEAINDNSAERCHSCNAQFRVEPQGVALDLDAPAQGRRLNARSTAVLAVLPLVVGGAAYYFFYASSQAGTPPQPGPKLQAPQKSEPQSQPDVAPPGEEASLRTASPEPKRASATVAAAIIPVSESPAMIAPAEATNHEPAGCAPGVMARGLCNSK